MLSLTRAGAELSPREIHARRRVAERKDGPLVREIMAALNERARMLREGVSEADVTRGLAAVLREHLPKGREEPWHYHCETCKDIGLRTVMIFAEIYQENAPYTVPCTCPKGVAWRETHRRRLDNLEQVGKTKRGSGWRRATA